MREGNTMQQGLLLHATAICSSIGVAEWVPPRSVAPDRVGSDLAPTSLQEENVRPHRGAEPVSSEGPERGHSQ
jgi:hypothetical protein